MRMYDIIKKKRDGHALTKEEIDFVIKGTVIGDIPDYQLSALLMAIYFQKMNEEETANLTFAIRDSGETVDLSAIDGVIVDKHSTGGVGDKTTLAVAPIVASCGVKIAKMSGRGLGHTGGTIDKLESITGFRTELTREEFFDTVNSVGVSVIGQSGNLAPADKKLYALRDVTATVDNVSLIASSIMGKKLASGSDCILLDVKTGSGSFMKTVDDARALAEAMVKIGKKANKKVIALITDMDVPLGNAVGNSLEVIEAVNTLKGKGAADFTEICLQLSANMLYMANVGDIKYCYNLAKNAIADGRAFDTLVRMVKAQGGDVELLIDTEKFPKAEICYDVIADRDGYICHIDAEAYGEASLVLGAGREKKGEKIDFCAGLIICKKTGDYVRKGETLVRLFANRKNAVADAEKRIREATTFSDEEPKRRPLILAKVE